MDKLKAQKGKTNNLKIASAIATLIITSSVGLITLNNKHIKVATIGEEDVYVSNEIELDDFKAYIEMANYEIQQMGGQVALEDVVYINGVVSEKSVISRLNAKIMRREPKEIKDKVEKDKYKLAREIMMKKSEQIDVSYLLELKTIEADTSLLNNI